MESFVANVYFESSEYCKGKEVGMCLHVCCITEISRSNETMKTKKGRPTRVT
jgi:hypothetical protein